MNKTKIGVIIAGAIIVLWIFWYLASPLFINKTVDEGLPVSENQNMQTTENPETGVTSEFQGTFIDADSFHKTKGKFIIFTEGGKKYLRFENFETTNGPDLKVYLSTDTKATDYYSFGDLKGNIGNQNYEIPNDVNVEDYNYVLIWCEAFSVLFGSAEI